MYIVHLSHPHFSETELPATLRHLVVNISLERIIFWSCENHKGLPGECISSTIFKSKQFGSVIIFLSFPKGGTTSKLLWETRGFAQRLAQSDLSWTFSTGKSNIGMFPQRMAFSANFDSLELQDLEIRKALFEWDCTDSAISDDL